MATLPTTVLSVSELDNLPVVEEIVMIETALIDAGSRLRAVDEVWAGALGDLMLREGQRDAIDVCRGEGGRFTLAGAGGHRLRAAQLRDIEALKARIWPNDPNSAMLREIADLLHRSDVAPYDRAVCIAEAVDCYKRMRGIDPAKEGRAASANARWQQVLSDQAEDANVTMTLAYGWTAEVAEQLGLSKSTIERALLLRRRIDASLVARLRKAAHPVATNDSQLRTLAKLEPSEQCRVVDQLVDVSAPAKTVADAQSRLGPKSEPITPDKKRFNAVVGTLQRMSVTERIGLFQSRQFHDVIPAEARRLLAPMLSDGAEDERDDDTNSATVASSGKAGLAGNVGPVLDRGDDQDGSGRDGGGSGQGPLSHDPALAGRSRVSEAAADELASEAPKPAVPIHKSVKQDHLACLECGAHVVGLTAHLRTAHGLTRDAYLLRWKLAGDYPRVAPSSEPSADLIADCNGDLEDILAVLASWYAWEPKVQLAAIEAAGGLRRIINGTEELKLAKIKATCTAGGAGLIAAWVRAAERKLYPEEDEA